MKTRRSFYVSGMTMAGIFLFCFLSLFSLGASSVQAGIADHLVINELSTAGASTYDDWVELYNPTGAAISLSSWSLQKSTSGGTITRTDLSGTIPAHGYFLVVRNDANTSASLKDSADLLASNLSLADNNALYLVNSNTNIDPDNLSAVFADLVGWSGISYGEDSAFTASIGAGKSLSRVPDGEDSDNNMVDFKILNTPTPQNSSFTTNNNDLEGSVLVTITPNAIPVQSISANSAKIVFQVNSNGSAEVEYGLSASYSSSSDEVSVIANSDVMVELTDLKCGTEYHYKINAVNTGGTDFDSSGDSVFATLPCGIKLDNLLMTRSAARANNTYASGWEWRFDITVWNENETNLKMKFSSWSGLSTLSAAGNIRYSVDNGLTWADVSSNDSYTGAGLNIGGINNSLDPGRQVSILVQMKVPNGTLTGNYGASYGIMTE
jgi:hypothetical protein